MQRLLSPWRLRYVASERRRRDRCVFCHAARARGGRDSLVLLRGRTHFAILNKYPYNNGHLMIVPFAHLATPSLARPDALAELMTLTVACERAIRSVYRPAGINLGMNLGKSAGAGIEGHYHMHMVPRWEGDTNFMTAVHDTRVIPESLRTAVRRLRPALAEEILARPGAAHPAPRARRPASRGGRA